MYKYLTRKWLLKFPCCFSHSSSLSWKGSWMRSISSFLRRSVSTSTWSSRTKVSERTPCARLCPITAARVPALARDPPPTAPHLRTRQRLIAAPGTGAWTIASPHWLIPLPRLPLLSCRRRRCHTVKGIIVKRNIIALKQGSIMITMWDSHDINY